MKRGIALLASAMLLVLPGCSTEQNKEKKATIYPEHIQIVANDFENAEIPPKEIFTTYEEENGLGGTLYKFVGTVKQSFTAEKSKSGIPYIIVGTEYGDMTISDVSGEMIAQYDGNDLDTNKFRDFFEFPTVGEYVCVYAEYQGMSEVLEYPNSTYGGSEYMTNAFVLSVDYDDQEQQETEINEAEQEFEPTEPEVSLPSIGEQNALSKAHDYLAFTAFSYNGLIEQLEYEGFTTEEAKYAADNCGADWNMQAAQKAKDYLNYTSFSRQGLIDQLLYEGFTQEQAEYGVTAAGY